jgi:hypothetical protein
MIYRAKDLGEFVFSLISLSISVNVIFEIVISTLKSNKRVLFVLAHISLILYWIWSLGYLVIFK